MSPSPLAVSIIGEACQLRLFIVRPERVKFIWNPSDQRSSGSLLCFFVFLIVLNKWPLGLKAPFSGQLDIQWMDGKHII